MKMETLDSNSHLFSNLKTFDLLRESMLAKYITFLEQ